MSSEWIDLPEHTTVKYGDKEITLCMWREDNGIVYLVQDKEGNLFELRKKGVNSD